MSYQTPSSKPSLTAADKHAKILEWANDRELFKREALFIRPKEGGVIPYCEREIQKDANFITRKYRRAIFLKARQLGITTGALADLFHDFLFSPFTKIAFVAHHGSTAVEIFEIVDTFYQFLPAWMRKLKLFRRVKDSANALSLRNGSSFKVGTANSEFWRGQTFQHAHLSEAAFYENLKKVFASITMAVGDKGTITFETTANGHNSFQKLWANEKSGYTRVFYSWLTDPHYVHDFLPDDLTEVETGYIEEWALPPERAAWFVKTFREKCASDLTVFNQEMPIAPEVAFAATGARYFHKVFLPNKVSEETLQVFEQYRPNNAYSIGADPASGAPTGDLSAAVVLNVTDKKRPRIAAVFAARLSIPDFAAIIQLLHNTYGKCVVNPELNNHGLALITELQHLGVTRLFRDSTFNGKVQHWANQFGTLITTTSRNLLLSKLREVIATNRLLVACTRLQQQMDHFVYNSKQKPEHEVGEHDDIIFAAAHAFYAASAATNYVPVEPTPVLHTQVERLQWELTNSRIYDGDYHDVNADLDW